VNAVRRVMGRALPLDRADIDTDQIIPAHWLKRVERTGYGAGLFEAWRRDPAFVLNDPRYAGASILITGPNFGSGSSREHAVWALEESGFRAVIAPRLADIFRANCLKSGLVPVEVEPDAAAKLLRLAESDPRTEMIVDVENRVVDAPGVHASFALDDHARTRLLAGLDDIAVTLAHADEITKYESQRAAWLPSLRD
jgi:3-isopropylmalate/(R)-2-methylmalate dehydratase small subunit